MQDLFEKLRDYPLKKQRIIQIIIGAIAGALTIVTLFFARNNNNLILLCLVLFVIAILIRNKLSSTSEWNTLPFSISMGIILAVGIIVLVVYGIIKGY